MLETGVWRTETDNRPQRTPRYAYAMRMSRAVKIGQRTSLHNALTALWSEVPWFLTASVNAPAIQDSPTQSEATPPTSARPQSNWSTRDGTMRPYVNKLPIVTAWTMNEAATTSQPRQPPSDVSVSSIPSSVVMTTPAHGELTRCSQF